MTCGEALRAVRARYGRAGRAKSTRSSTGALRRKVGYARAGAGVVWTGHGSTWEEALRAAGIRAP